MRQVARYEETYQMAIPADHRSDGVPPWVPGTIKTKIDLAEFTEADHPSVCERDRLGKALGLNIAAYKLSGRTNTNGLCAIYQSADLTSEQLQMLRASEQKYVGVAFVAYRNPLQQHDRTDEA